LVSRPGVELSWGRKPLPARGRTILGQEAIEILCQEIPTIVEKSLKWKYLDKNACNLFVDCVENQESIRKQLDHANLSAFVANGSILPRESGISDRTLTGENVVEFQSPESLKTSFALANSLLNGENVIHGMGIPQGVTLIVGGGYH